ncbi:DUF2515 family protein [Cohnella sp.]|uniref:DUF2515 family protein n=1 Tax=Cohnella sp. TaxID=1883426 RepID=UPI003568866A
MQKKPGVDSGIATLLRMTQRLASGLVNKSSGLIRSYRLTRHKHPLLLDREFSQHLTSLLTSAPEHDTLQRASPSELQLCEDIHNETIQLNRNNITRTEAYWQMYKTFPELHWALLAHLVSRNGGWSMTDLKGQWLPALLDKALIAATFDLLEACNSLIFGDAYPQLRLYAESKRLDRNLFFLLPRFGVSAFMHPIWNRFWLDQDPVPLTIALVVNEQNFIQSRVVEDGRYKQHVFSSLSFRSQPLLQMNQIVFPLSQEGNSNRGNPMRLAGRVLENFEDLQERIGFGKSLYGMLFGYPAVLERVIAFCERVMHTGSRADYWPHCFTFTCKQITGGKPMRAEHAAGLLSSLWFSPMLSEAWPDRPIVPATEGDWYRDTDVLAFMTKIRLPRIIDMTHEHLFGQNKLQAAVLLERSFMKGASRRRTGRG